MNYWLMKSEPDEFSIDDLVAAPKQTTPWFGVRNYTARNFMRDEMRVGDGVLFYHSSCPEPGIARMNWCLTPGLIPELAPGYPAVFVQAAPRTIGSRRMPTGHRR